MNEISRRKNVFQDYGREFYAPQTVIDALNDAIEQMNYSNFHCDKFERAIVIVRRYCKDRGIPLKRPATNATS